MAEALRCKVVIPIHYDVWTNFKADTNEINVLYEMKKYRLDYKFHPFIWDVGASMYIRQTRTRGSITTAEALRTASSIPRTSPSVLFCNWRLS